ncbi:hypothetical protein GDO81_005252 [Engystomops pustulosus]|uniref:Uncharacterized protein n=1 Tax=Engystomops pustulosus TaxID=76066 RepID=A0AAV7CMS8_ENGPU|nr:hypothetical protein GDO81_005252 [Engystomops pustulosus]
MYEYIYIEISDIWAGPQESNQAAVCYYSKVMCKFEYQHFGSLLWSWKVILNSDILFCKMFYYLKYFFQMVLYERENIHITEHFVLQFLCVLNYIFLQHGLCAYKYILSLTVTGCPTKKECFTYCWHFHVQSVHVQYLFKVIWLH